MYGVYMVAGRLKDSTGADYSQVGDAGKIQCDMGNSERNAND